MRYLYLLLIILSANDLFNLVPWAHIAGVFNVSDIGILLIIIGVASILLYSKRLQILSNLYTVLVLVFLLFTAVQASLAAFNYDQSIINGVIGARHYMYYLSFVVFLYVLDDREKVRKFLDLLSILAILLLFLSIINYITPIIFYHRWAEGVGIRSGITRAFIPGMDVLTLGAIWQFSRWSERAGQHKYSGALSVVLYGAHVFRQTRSRIVWLTVILFGLLLYRKSYAVFSVAALLGLIGVVVLQFSMEENPLVQVFTSSVEEVAAGSEGQRSRWYYLNVDIELFKEHPWFGSGTEALRLSPDAGSNRFSLQELATISAVGDLGYPHWLRAYGLAGMAWLLAVYYFFFTRAREAIGLVPDKDKDIPVFTLSYFSFVALSFVTLNHFMDPARILLISLCAAILIRIHWDAKKDLETSR